MTQCFMIEPTGFVVPHAVVIEEGCTDTEYHRAVTEYGIEPERTDERGILETPEVVRNWDLVDWPTHCDSCGYEFTEASLRSTSARRQWRGPDGTVHGLPRDFGPGAMWDAYWMPFSKGPDGRCLVVILPDGYEWMIDSRANNCTRPDDNEHQCWVRHGEPPNVTIDKNGNTCHAGAGSIASPNYHGFLRNGAFT